MMESARQELQGRREYMSNDEIKRLAGSIKCPMEQLLIRLIISWFHLTIFLYLGLDFFTWDGIDYEGAEPQFAWDHDDCKTFELLTNCESRIF